MSWDSIRQMYANHGIDIDELKIKFDNLTKENAFIDSDFWDYVYSVTGLRGNKNG